MYAEAPASAWIGNFTLVAGVALNPRRSAAILTHRAVARTAMARRRPVVSPYKHGGTKLVKLARKCSLLQKEGLGVVDLIKK